MKRNTRPTPLRASWLRGGALLAALAALGLGGCALNRLHTGRTLAAQALPFSAHPQAPQRRLLLVGDSTAVGTGASSAAHSVAGLMAADHPDWRIENLAVNGARFEDVVQQLKHASGQHDLVLVLAGGNDVIGLTNEQDLRTAVSEVLALAHRRGRAVVLMPCGNVGHAPFFFAPVSWLMSQRSQTLHAVVAEATQASGSRYVRLLQPPESDPFVLEPERLNAADGLHPSDAGYRQWYAELRRQGGLD
jgi:lysophospholipase L1-like esterase